MDFDFYFYGLGGKIICQREEITLPLIFNTVRGLFVALETTTIVF